MSRKYMLIFLFTLLAGSFFYFQKTAEYQPDRSLSSTSANFASVDEFSKNVKPIFDNRCVACHSCYNSPCQLNLASFEGFARGIHPSLKVYNNKRLQAQKPSRLFVDAHSSDEWQQQHGFKSAHDLIRVAITTNNNGDTSISPELSRQCSVNNTPPLAMPYGLPKLKEDEIKRINQWLDNGAPAPQVDRAPSEHTSQHINKWQNYLNRNGKKEQLIARYIYEHLFLAHIHFDNHREFYRLIRAKSSCEKGEDVATRRPYDKAENFKYCFRKITSTLVHKTHITYQLSDKKLKRYNSLFDQTDWNVQQLPSYEAEKASNPFITFDAIPAKSRYQFLLDDARYFVMTFIRGPVCKGNTAVNVINEQFHVMFIDPDAYPAQALHDFVSENKSLLGMPAKYGSNIEVNSAVIGNIGGIFGKEGKIEEIKGIAKAMFGYSGISWWANTLATLKGFKTPKNGFIGDRRSYRAKRYEFFKKHHPKGYDEKHIWDGDGHNKNALLTILRHHDSASVSFGALGPTPKTLWVIDYAELESIYYNLVAGFDVYGDAGHQSSTRYYKSIQRLDGEEHFLYLLENSLRGPMRQSWYKDSPEHDRPTRKILNKWYPISTIEGDNSSQSLSEEELEEIRKDTFSRIYNKRLQSLNANRNAHVFKKINGVKAKDANYVQFFPDHSFIKVGSSVYTLIRNKQHYNVSWVMDENLRRDHDNDTLFAVKGFVGSYPMQFFEVQENQLNNFIDDMRSLKSESDFKNFMSKYGISRESEKFWPTYDFMNSKLREQSELEFGLLDLNRYGIKTID